MIKSITIENFFSFAGKTEIEVNPGVNVLVGINGSGKSNFLRALRLMGEFWTGKGDLEEILIREWGGAFQSCKLRGQEVQESFNQSPERFASIF